MHTNGPRPIRAARVIFLYLKFCKSSLAPSSYLARLGYLRSFARYLGRRAVKKCRPIHALNWLAKHDEWSSDWTKNSIVRYIQAAFNWAVDIAEIIKKNPFRALKHPEGLPRRDLADHEYQSILRASHSARHQAGARFRRIVTFIRFTGCRPCEAYHLQWPQVDWERSQIVLPGHKTVRTQRTPQPRVIYLPPVALNLLRWLYARRTDDTYVFRTFRGTPWNRHSLAHRIQRAREAAGLKDDAKLYGLRHAFGTRAIMAGVHLKTVSELMGHTTTKMTERYVHLAGRHNHMNDALKNIYKSPAKNQPAKNAKEEKAAPHRRAKPPSAS